MRHRIEFTDKAVEGLESLTAMVRERVFKKIRWMSENFDDIRHQGHWYRLARSYKPCNTGCSRNQANLE